MNSERKTRAECNYVVNILLLVWSTFGCLVCKGQVNFSFWLFQDFPFLKRVCKSCNYFLESKFGNSSEFFKFNVFILIYMNKYFIEFEENERVFFYLKSTTRDLTKYLRFVFPRINKVYLGRWEGEGGREGGGAIRKFLGVSPKRWIVIIGIESQPEDFVIFPSSVWRSKQNNFM